MAAIQPRSAEAFLRRPDSHYAVILLYGPDHGLVSERAKGLAAVFVDDVGDPFQLIKLNGDEISTDPGRLADEALTIPMFGGRRAVWVKAGAKSLVAAVEPMLSDPPAECRIIIEGGDWKKSHALVGLVERSRAGATLACFGDEGVAVTKIIAEEVAAANLAITPQAREALVGLLGADRLASRGELRKLALYAHGAGRIELSDVEAVVGDASAFAIDDVIDAAFSGHTEALDASLARAWAEGVNPSVLAGTALRYALTLHRLRGEADKGKSEAGVVEASRGAIHWRRKAAASAQLSAHDQERLDRIVADLASTVLESRRSAALGRALTSRALMRIALGTRARPR